MPRAKSREKVPEAAPSMTEAQVLSAVLEAAQMLGLDLNRQNTGAAVNPKGRMVMFGKPGASDCIGTLPDGRTIMVECKREGFDPAKLSGDKKEHFDRQLERLQKTNALGGVGLWVDSGTEFLMIMGHVLAGARVEEPGYGKLVVTYEPRETH